MACICTIWRCCGSCSPGRCTPRSLFIEKRGADPLRAPANAIMVEARATG